MDSMYGCTYSYPKTPQFDGIRYKPMYFYDQYGIYDTNDDLYYYNFTNTLSADTRNGHEYRHFKTTKPDEIMISRLDAFKHFDMYVPSDLTTKNIPWYSQRDRFTDACQFLCGQMAGCSLYYSEFTGGT